MRGMWETVQSRKQRIGSAVVVVMVTAVLFLYNWTIEAAADAHTMPKIAWYDIETMVSQPVLEAAQLQVVAEQTGLDEMVVESFVKRGQGQQLLKLQEVYFAPVLVKSIKSTPLTVAEYLVDEGRNDVTGMPLVDVQDGDILITKNSRFLGWRNGHAGLVVDAKKGLVLEAVMLGTDTRLCSLKKWERYPSFQVLRLKEDRLVTAGFAVDYAMEHMIGVPYRLLAGVYSRLFLRDIVAVHTTEQKLIPELKGTQCAHLVWYAYKQAGIDLDSDGGLLVTPADLQNSPYLEVVQSYGY